MARVTEYISSDNDDDVIASFTERAKANQSKQQSLPANENLRDQRDKSPPQRLKAVLVPPVHHRHEYIYYDGRETVERIRHEVSKRGELIYDVEFVDGSTKRASHTLTFNVNSVVT